MWLRDAAALCLYGQASVQGLFGLKKELCCALSGFDWISVQRIFDAAPLFDWISVQRIFDAAAPQRDVKANESDTGRKLYDIVIIIGYHSRKSTC